MLKNNINRTMEEQAMFRLPRSVMVRGGAKLIVHKWFNTRRYSTALKEFNKSDFKAV
jgi:hypothetical protein